MHADHAGLHHALSMASMRHGPASPSPGPTAPVIARAGTERGRRKSSLAPGHIKDYLNYASTRMNSGTAAAQSGSNHLVHRAASGRSSVAGGNVFTRHAELEALTRFDSKSGMGANMRRTARSNRCSSIHGKDSLQGFDPHASSKRASSPVPSKLSQVSVANVAGRAVKLMVSLFLSYTHVWITC